MRKQLAKRTLAQKTMDRVFLHFGAPSHLELSANRGSVCPLPTGHARTDSPDVRARAPHRAARDDMAVVKHLKLARSRAQRADCAAAARGSVSPIAKKDETDPLSEEQRQRKVQKGREALQRFLATKDAGDRGAPGVAAHRICATLEGRDNITGRFVAPVENPFKICAPPP